jgi:phosphoribosyl 1,2-cyclic phosphodiesterase
MLDLSLIQSFDDKQSIDIHELSIIPFQKKHDAADPYSFTISFNGINIGVYTDIGQPCAALKEHFNTCDAAFLEANYDEEMLEKGTYPYYLKERIASNKGHLSNKQALEIFMQYKPEFMSHLILSHLSKDNNCPQLVKELFLKHAAQTHIVVASRLNETEVFTITKNKINLVLKPSEQISLF